MQSVQRQNDLHNANNSLYINHIKIVQNIRKGELSLQGYSVCDYYNVFFKLLYECIVLNIYCFNLT